jgi:hypothetical protein
MALAKCSVTEHLEAAWKEICCRVDPIDDGEDDAPYSPAKGVERSDNLDGANTLDFVEGADGSPLAGVGASTGDFCWINWQA